DHHVRKRRIQHADDHCIYSRKLQQLGTRGVGAVVEHYCKATVLVHRQPRSSSCEVFAIISNGRRAIGSPQVYLSWFRRPGQYLIAIEHEHELDGTALLRRLPPETDA